MRITDIQHCEVRPGRLVEWTFSPATVAAARELPEDPRPPAYIQEAHIRTTRLVREDGLFVPTWLGASFDIPGSVDLDVLQEALRRWTLRHETLRSGFRRVGDELRRFTLEAGAVSLDREVIGDFADAEVLVRRLQDRFDRAADALIWPNLIYAAVVRDDGASVYLAFDHSNVDAHSLQRVPADIHELYAEVRDRCEARDLSAPRAPSRPPVQTEPAAAASYVDFCDLERQDADRVDVDHEIVARWREFIRRCGGTLPRFPVDLGLKPGGALPPQQVISEPLADADTAAAFESYCRPFGGSMVGVLAATALIVHELGGQLVYRTVVPFHTRLKSHWSNSVGWYVGGAPLEVPVTDTTDFPDALRTVRAELRETKPLARVPLDRVLRLLGAHFRPPSPDLYSLVSFLDCRDIPGSRHWVDLKAYGLVRVSYGDQACVWVNRLHEGLWLACRHPDTDTARKNMRLYVERLRNLITTTARSRPPGASPPPRPGRHGA